ncbi:MAG TPA: hypothetical protein VFD36_27390 [Kofleriaceae bacterium]|nr:hypothetical protein [Kofleriaceae bacterium]
MADPKDKHHRHDAHKSTGGMTAGPDYDDRGPDPQRDQEAALRAAHIQLAHDRQVRIIGVSVKGNGTEVLLGSGFKQGVTEGMEGYIAGEHGPYADFTITHVDEVTSKAVIEATVDEIRAHMQTVIINPSHKPQAVLPPDTKVRVMAISVENNKLRIKVPRGRMQGAKWGDLGIVVNAAGVRQAHFTLDDVGPRMSAALVDMTPDSIRDCDIILKPSKH